MADSIEVVVDLTDSTSPSEASTSASATASNPSTASPDLVQMEQGECYHVDPTTTTVKTTKGMYEVIGGIDNRISYVPSVYVSSETVARGGISVCGCNGDWAGPNPAPAPVPGPPHPDLVAWRESVSAHAGSFDKFTSFFDIGTQSMGTEELINSFAKMNKTQVDEYVKAKEEKMRTSMPSEGKLQTGEFLRYLQSHEEQTKKFLERAYEPQVEPGPGAQYFGARRCPKPAETETTTPTTPPKSTETSTTTTETTTTTTTTTTPPKVTTTTTPPKVTTTTTTPPKVTTTTTPPKTATTTPPTTTATTPPKTAATAASTTTGRIEYDPPMYAVAVPSLAVGTVPSLPAPSSCCCAADDLL